MWIRSQDKELIVKVNGIGITVMMNKQVLIWGVNVDDKHTLARYSSKERAIEELDRICEFFHRCQSDCLIYQMRGENEK